MIDAVDRTTLVCTNINRCSYRVRNTDKVDLMNKPHNIIIDKQNGARGARRLLRHPKTLIRKGKVQWVGWRLTAVGRSESKGVKAWQTVEERYFSLVLGDL